MKKDFAAFISDFNAVVAERAPQYIKSVYDFLSKLKRLLKKGG